MGLTKGWVTTCSWLLFMLTSRKLILLLNPVSVMNFNVEFCSKAYKAYTPHQLSISHMYYINQFSDNYKLYERIMKHIIKNNVKCCNPKDSIQFTPYYRSNKITNLIIKNNQTPPTNALKRPTSFTNFLAMKETVNSITKHT